MTDPPLLGVNGHRMAKRMHAKHIHWIMDLYPDLLPALGRQVHPYLYKIAHYKMQVMMKKADMIVPISNCMARYLSHNAVARNHMKVIENWPNKYLLEDADDSQSLLDDSKFRILYAGTIGLAHEFDTVLSAAAYFQKMDQDIEFIFTARGRGYSAFEKKVKEKGLTNVRFLPSQPSKKLNALLNAGDLHLVTLKKSAAGKLFPSKFYSACAAGRPVLYVGPTSCDIHRKITQHHCGATIRNGEGRLLINAIENYKTNPDDWFMACKNASAVLGDHRPLEQWAALIDSL
jgi:glycosyltransferase involved in cell wall biosynthesis